MLLWVLLLAGTMAAMISLIVAMYRAERRARRNLYRALDLSEETVDLLMARNGDVRSELTLVRISPPKASDLGEQEAPGRPAASRPTLFSRHPTIRLVHPTSEANDIEPPEEDLSGSTRNQGS